MLGSAVRCGLGGAALGLATLAAFSFVGVPVVPTGLEDALLSAEDLPPGFAREATPPGPAVPAGCAGLLADPAAGWAGAVERRYRQAGTGARVWEAVARPDGDALSDLRARLTACRNLMTHRVPGGEVYEVAGGYLAAARVGRTVLVLRYLGPQPASEILDTALDKVGAAAA